MALHTDIDDLHANGRKGDWCFMNNETYIALLLGNEPFTDLAVLPIKPTENTASWAWDGNKEAPTLSPSILHWGHGRAKPATFHGYLRDGKLIDA